MNTNTKQMNRITKRTFVIQLSPACSTPVHYLNTDIALPLSDVLNTESVISSKAEEGPM
jgi:hypothetical protein